MSLFTYFKRGKDAGLPKRGAKKPIRRTERRPLGLEQLEDRTVMSVCCGDFLTYTQGGWGAVPNGGNPGTYLHANFDAAFVNGLQIGSQAAGAANSDNTAGNWAALFTSAQAVTDWLPHTGPSGALGGDTVNPLPGSDPDDGTLAGQTAALSLSVGFDLYDADFSPSATNLRDLTVTSGVFSGQTVQYVLNTCNTILAGGSVTLGTHTFTASEANEAATAINENFDNGSANGGTDNGFLDCDCPPPGTSTVLISGMKFEDHNGNGVQDVGDNGINDWHITVWVDSDGDGVHDNGETHDVVTATTDGVDGVYTYTEEVSNDVLAGGISYEVQEVTQTGWTQTYGNEGYSDSFGTGDTADVGVANFGNFKNIDICGTKFYDNNADGIKNDSAVVEGWTIVLYSDNNTASDASDDWTTTTTTGADGTYCFTNLGPGSYAVIEAAGGAGWIQTYGIGGHEVTASSGVNSDGNDYGNLLECKGSGGVTLGYWSNKNGQAVLNADGFTDDKTLLNTLYLKNANGTDYCATTSSALKTWLLNATATNMAYMLSAQLATTELSMLEAGTGSFVGLNGSQIIDTGTLLTAYAGQITGLNVVVDGANVTHGFITINDLMAAANYQLQIDLDGLALAGAGNRPIEEALKTALDLLNNNLLNFVMNVTTSINASATC